LRLLPTIGRGNVCRHLAFPCFRLSAALFYDERNFQTYTRHRRETVEIPQAPVEVVATGFDGTTAPIRGEDYKEAICGTIALYDRRGERLLTEYLGSMPEAGKADFTNRFTSRVARVLERYPKALHVVLSDGALWNWQLIKEQYPEAIWILDYIQEDFATLEIAEHFFSKGEVTALKSLPADQRTMGFFNCWSRKEAFIKAKGMGVSYPLDRFTVSLAPGDPPALLKVDGNEREVAQWKMYELKPGAGYVAAMIATAPPVRLKRRHWTE
jgi:phosphopantetheine--protein transferase-like protein